jgi:hypothetical protein
MITKEERQKMMLSESRFERKRIWRAIISPSYGKRIKYFSMRRNFWKHTVGREQYMLMKAIYDL